MLLIILFLVLTEVDTVLHGQLVLGVKASAQILVIHVPETATLSLQPYEH
jgi:hypothetical protein